MADWRINYDDPPKKGWARAKEWLSGLWEDVSWSISSTIEDTGAFIADNWGGIALAIVCIIAIVLLCLAIKESIYWNGPAGCDLKTSGLLIHHRYLDHVGCQVYVSDVGWINLENFRAGP